MSQFIQNTSRSDDFFDFLHEEKLEYSVEMVENFLLSIKVKPFLILSGGTGTGKTKLAQAYGKYISGSLDDYTIATTEVTLKKADTNNGFTLAADDFFDSLPYDGRKADGEYKVKLGNLETECTIKMAPRLWYKPNAKLFKEEINNLKKQGKDKETLVLYIPRKSSGGNNYEIIPVGSNWTESRFITGYKNVLTGKYSSTKALDLIIKANKNPSETYILILDEMNLSHVERYFSEFLSAMESGEKIQLDSDGSEIPQTITIGDNLIIVGTVNVDETTYAFSPKVLDRANVIEFESIPVSKMILNTFEEKIPDGNIEYLQNYNEGISVRKMNAVDICNELRSVPANSAIIDEMILDLEKMQTILNTVNLSFGFRTIDEIFRFMYVSWVYKKRGEFGTWKRFFDTQIKQKILPKIHGNLNIKDALVSMLDICSDKGYNTSATKIKAMVETLEKQRYVSFNN